MEKTKEISRQALPILIFGALTILHALLLLPQIGLGSAIVIIIAGYYVIKLAWMVDKTS